MRLDRSQVARIARVTAVRERWADAEQWQLWAELRDEPDVSYDIGTTCCAGHLMEGIPVLAQRIEEAGTALQGGYIVPAPDRIEIAFVRDESEVPADKLELYRETMRRARAEVERIAREGAADGN